MSRISASDSEKGRITARVPLKVQETIQRAADLTGIPLNAYIIQVVHQAALEVIDRFDMKRIVFSEQDSEWFIEQMAKPRPPNARLRQAATAYNEDYHVSPDSPTVPGTT